MSIYELTDANGRRLRIVLGWGSPVCNQANLFGNPFAAQAFVDALDPDTRSAISARFMEAFRDQPRHINPLMGAPTLSGRSDPNQIFLSPDARLTRAIANSELLVQTDDSLLPVDDNRAELRMKIRMQLNSMLADERREAAMYQAQMDQESTFSKGLIYTGAFFHGLGTAAWDTLKWAKEVSDLGNPVVQLRNMFNAAYDAYGEDQVVESFAKNLQAAQWREIVEALGFDPSKITSEMIAQAMDAADVIWEDKTLRQDLTNFAWDYVKAQHAVELTQMGGGAALEIVITAILAALTAGAGLAAATAAKARHLPKLRKLGDLLLEFVDQSKKLGRYLKEKAKRAAKGEKGKPLDAEPVVERVNEPPRANDSTGDSGGNSGPNVNGEGVAAKKYHANNLVDAETRLAERRQQIASEGYTPKYTDDELAFIAQNGDVGAERFQVRFIETKYLVNRDTPSEHLSGAMGMTMDGATGKGSKYWSTSLDQLEDADTDPRLIAEKLGLEYNSKADYTLIVVDMDKAAPLTGVKSVPATFEKVGEFANTELPSDFPKSFTDKVMTPEFQSEYAKHYQAAFDEGYLPNLWSKDAGKFERYLSSTGMSADEVAIMKQRMVMHDKIGNNQDYVGNGLTKDIIEGSANEFGAVETLNFERKEINLKQLDDANAIKILPSLKPI